MIFLLQKQFFENIITEGGLKLIALNPFLDYLLGKAHKQNGDTHMQIFTSDWKY